MDWLESFLVREGLSSSAASEFRQVLLRLRITRVSGDIQNDPFVLFFEKHHTEMNEWQIHFFTDIAWIMYQVGLIHGDNYDQKLMGIQKTISLILKRSFHLEHANQIAPLILDIGKNKSPESKALAQDRLTKLIRQKDTAGSHIFGTKQVIGMFTELATVLVQEQTELIDPEQ
jgi:hypothetical protein